MDSVFLDLARAAVASAPGGGGAISEMMPLPATSGAVVLRLILSDGRRLVLKVADGDNESADFHRTRAVTELARAAGVPVPAVLAADNTGHHGRRYLLLEHLDGVPWRQVRPTLDLGQVAAAEEQIAGAVVSLQSIGFDSFGELDGNAEPAGQNLLDALHARAELRMVGSRERDTFHSLLDRDAELFRGPQLPTLSHDDLHHGNLLFRERQGRWELAGLLDWDKAWAGPAESDIARMQFWDDMTGPGFWRVYRAAVPAAEGHRQRSLIYQLLWCLEYQSGSARHAADTATLARRLGVASSDIKDSHHLTLQESS
jgi:aminoglycoside phosphotransferase (APT) family kinase protein